MSTVKRLQLDDLRPDEFDGRRYGRILCTKDDDPVLINGLTAFFRRYGITDTRNTFGRLGEYRFVSKKYLQRNAFTSGFDSRTLLLQLAADDDWIVEPFTREFIGLFKPPTFEAERELERQLFIELVSVPAGRFKGLLVDGGVEYQRQMAQLGDLCDGLN